MEDRFWAGGAAMMASRVDERVHAGGRGVSLLGDRRVTLRSCSLGALGAVGLGLSGSAAGVPAAGVEAARGGESACDGDLGTDELVRCLKRQASLSRGRFVRSAGRMSERASERGSGTR